MLLLASLIRKWANNSWGISFIVVYRNIHTSWAKALCLRSMLPELIIFSIVQKRWPKDMTIHADNFFRLKNKNKQDTRNTRNSGSDIWLCNHFWCIPINLCLDLHVTDLARSDKRIVNYVQTWF